jgi:hypothetical protein
MERVSVHLLLIQHSNEKGIGMYLHIEPYFEHLNSLSIRLYLIISENTRNSSSSPENG